MVAIRIMFWAGLGHLLQNLSKRVSCDQIEPPTPVCVLADFQDLADLHGYNNQHSPPTQCVELVSDQSSYTSTTSSTGKAFSGSTPVYKIHQIHQYWQHSRDSSVLDGLSGVPWNTLKHALRCLRIIGGRWWTPVEWCVFIFINRSYEYYVQACWTENRTQLFAVVICERVNICRTVSFNWEKRLLFSSTAQYAVFTCESAQSSLISDADVATTWKREERPLQHITFDFGAQRRQRGYGHKSRSGQAEDAARQPGWESDARLTFKSVASGDPLLRVQRKPTIVWCSESASSQLFSSATCSALFAAWQLASPQLFSVAGAHLAQAECFISTLISYSFLWTLLTVCNVCKLMTLMQIKGTCKGFLGNSALSPKNVGFSAEWIVRIRELFAMLSTVR